VTDVQLTDGKIAAADLGKTLIHEHILVGFTGWQYDVRTPKFVRADAMAQAVDRLQELKDYGCSTVVDPCPMDVGRDVEFVAEVAQKSGMRIVVATGVYTEKDCAWPAIRWQGKEELVDLYVKELTEGVGDTGIRCGVIKIATGEGPATEYERKMIGVAAEASKITGAPIISHTPIATYGHEQIDIVEGHGVPANCLVVGHSGDRDDIEYQKSLAARDAFLGLDRFGMDFILPDELRLKNLMQLVEAGYRDNILVSHDTILCWAGRRPPGFESFKLPEITRFFQVLAPKLLEMGLLREDLDRILIDNPRRLFNNAALQCTAHGPGCGHAHHAKETASA
jgi:phosphotriesterase-related protein